MNTGLLILAAATTGVVADEAPGLKAFERGDYETSFKEAAPAAEQGNAAAQFVLGGLYATGKSVPKDLNKACEWIKKSAMQDLNEAQYVMGDLKYNGACGQDEIHCSKVVQVTKMQIFSASRNCVESYAWFNLAASQGHKKATERRDELSTGIVLPPSQIQEAQNFSTRLKEEIEKNKLTEPKK